MKKLLKQGTLVLMSASLAALLAFALAGQYGFAGQASSTGSTLVAEEGGGETGGTGGHEGGGETGPTGGEGEGGEGGETAPTGSPSLA